MDDQAMVMSGEWSCNKGGFWEFVVDKEQFGRVVCIKPGDSLCSLKEACLVEFFGGLSGEYTVVGLSYWPPNSKELATGLKTPPVLLTSDGGLGYYLQHLRVNGATNLCVRFGRKNGSSNSGMMDFGVGFSTPCYASKSRTMFDENGSFRRGNDRTEDAGSCQGSKSAPVVLDDDDFVAEVEKLEASLTDDNVFVEGSEATDPEIDKIMEQVLPRGYDTEFWEPLLNDAYGGSNAVDIMCSDDDDSEYVPEAKVGRRDVLGDDAFVRKVLVDGEIGCSNRSANVGQSSIPGWKFSNPGEKVQTEYPTWTRTGGCKDKLADVDEDEFDLPPLFDDLDFVRSEIPDLDIDGGDERMYVGKVFGSKKDCQIAMAIYAIKNQFHFKQTTTKRDYFVLTCADERCEWRVMAHEQKGCGYYEIRKAQLEHSCAIETRNGYKRKGTSTIIAAVFKAKYGGGCSGPRAMDLQQLVLEELRMNSSYMKCYRAKERATSDVRGSEEDSYNELPQYLHMLKAANPGTVTHLEVDNDENGVCRFLYMFLAFGASIIGFRRVRRVIVVDGTHLTGKYKGVLLTASGQDANFQVYPLAFAVVDSENEDSWTWFFEKLEAIIADSNSLTIISDRHNAIYVAKKKIFPKAHHGACLVHLARNVCSKFHEKGLAKLVVQAGFAYKIGEFRKYYGKIRAANVDCATYLEKIGIGHWARAHFAGERYNLMTSNIAEQLNNALKKARASPIIELLQFIQVMMSRWFNCRRRKAGLNRGIVTPEVDKQMTKNMATCKGSRVNSVSSWSCEVVGRFNEKNHVILNEKRCTCRAYDKLKLPCGHALIAADNLGVHIGTLPTEHYKNDSWVDEYACLINPELDARDETLPIEITGLSTCPPNTRRPSGRPKEKRIPSKGDFGTKPKKAVPNRCGRCHLEGHNRSSCKNPI